MDFPHVEIQVTLCMILIGPLINFMSSRETAFAVDTLRRLDNEILIGQITVIKDLTCTTTYTGK